MIIGIGLDIVDVSRIKRMHDKFGVKFINKVLSSLEISHIPANPSMYLAGRFAAKEAAAKALGCGFTNGVFFTNIEIVNNNAGKPVLHFLGASKKMLDLIGATSVHVSITHEKNMAAAMVILEK